MNMKPETINKWKTALQDPVARERIVTGLKLHAEKNTISPDLAILSIIFSAEPSLEL